MNELIVDDVGNGLRVLTLNRPDQLNALSPELLLLLGEQVQKIRTSDVTCVVLRGAGRSFCAGYDLKARERAKSFLPPNYAAQTIDSIAALPQPVIASVHGHCVTGGLELALAADFMIVAEHARFADTHARWSMHAAWGLTQRLPRRIGAAAAKDVMFSGREIDGVEAVQLGLASRWAPDEELNDLTMRVASTICERPAEVLQWIKMQVDHGLELPLAQALEHERSNRPAGSTETDARLQQGWSKSKT
jgi:enoyl-CoA hydratase/carnithine racemase